MQLLTTAPPSAIFSGPEYLKTVIDLARKNEAAGVSGMLIYTDNSLIDPWTVAQAVLEQTRDFVPLVAVQPVYMSPYAAACKISSLAFLYGRKIALNMVAGGFRRDLEALGDHTEHDPRYDRLVEYTVILQALLRGESVTFEGEYYSVRNLGLAPALPPELMPDIYLSGASDACITACASLGAVRFSYTKPPAEMEEMAPLPGTGQIGLRVGIIARDSAAEAWDDARTRFPSDRRGQLSHKMARATSDSIWHRDISKMAEDLHEARDGAYWLYPVMNYRTFCPYLVGSHAEVASYLHRYRALGFTHLILDVPSSEADLHHALTAARLDQRVVATA
ncbi:LLM class flavin-dependent oxidoreductase [Phaeobacter sp. HF9A]|uniref:LLM class flavin-dependent oxidoreductase n=1 Tax=Phaeobacter sp. HF9A TaxID=2721561 RepID=UPI0014301122|nr:LLM class flavin-dependent oxidoreductase [Phaeobacter sp. HF9A]NIZ13561.1 LLM class flavin-dependent oxidoreductase [Phaeobacter sp. HF9A]